MIRAADRGGACVLTIDRPDKAGALSAAMLDDLCLGVEQATAPALILTGTGRVFSAGADLDEVRGGTLATSPLWERLSGAIAAYPGLTIAALNGTVAGGAMGMVLACDLRLAVPSAKAFYPVMRLGVLPQPSDPARLSALVGPSRARMILMAGHKASSDECLSWGLFDQVVDDDDPVAAALALAADALSAPAAHVTAIKRLLRSPLS